jgi:hypothetical protein
MVIKISDKRDNLPSIVKLTIKNNSKTFKINK